SYPKATQDRRRFGRYFAARNEATHEDEQKNGQRNSHTTDNDTRFDFGVALNLGCNPALLFKFCLADLLFLCREEHFRDPGFVPVEFLPWFSCRNYLLGCRQVRAAHFTEP